MAQTKGRIDMNVVGEPVEGFEEKVWKLRKYIDGFDYWDSYTEQLIWSIGRRVTDNKVFASVDSRFYQNPMFECLWVRNKEE